jgi:hypothetical protein
MPTHLFVGGSDLQLEVEMAPVPYYNQILGL